MARSNGFGFSLSSQTNASALETLIRVSSKAFLLRSDSRWKILCECGLSRGRGQRVQLP